MMTWVEAIIVGSSLGAATATLWQLRLTLAVRRQGEAALERANRLDVVRRQELEDLRARVARLEARVDPGRRPAGPELPAPSLLN